MARTEQPHSGWFVASGGVPGADHRAQARPCQDRHGWKALPGGILIAAVADGAGSRTRSGEGAEIVVRVALEELETLALAPPTTRDGWEHSVRDLFFRAWCALDDYATTELIRLNELDTTLTCVIATRDLCVIGQVGDGAVVLNLDRQGLVLPLPPETGEYANATWFITRLSSHPDHVHVAVVERPISGMGLITDGLVDYTLDGPPGHLGPRASFWETFLGIMRESIHDGDQSPRVEGLLGSAKVQEHSRDDLTLILAVPMGGTGTPAGRPLIAHLPAVINASTETGAMRRPASLPSSLQKSELVIGEAIAMGGTAAIHRLPAFPGHLVKLFHDPVDQTTAQKLGWMVSIQPAQDALERLLWPERLVHEQRGTIVGYAFRQPPVNTVSLENVCRNDRRAIFEALGREPFSLRERHGIAWNLATTLLMCHQHGFAGIGLWANHVLVTSKGHIVLADPDAFGVATADGRRFPATLQRPPAYTYRQPDDPAGGDLRSEDAFALSIVIFELLMDGMHPFLGKDVDGSPVAALTLMRARQYPYASPNHARFPGPPTTAPALARLHASVVSRFHDAFTGGMSDPRMLPDAKAWMHTLEQAMPHLQQCQRGHWYSADRPCCLERSLERYCGATTTTRPDPLPVNQVDPLTRVGGGDLADGRDSVAMPAGTSPPVQTASESGEHATEPLPLPVRPGELDEAGTRIRGERESGRRLPLRGRRRRVRR